jgi:pyruvate dehydrogenase E1 component alpha subunit
MREQNPVNLFRTALLTRRFEETIIKLTKEGFVPATLHPGAGQEVGQLAAIEALRSDDPVLYAHRGVAYMIGRGVPLSAILCDLAGREGGTNNGKGGVMHVVDPARGIWGESGTLGGGLVIATGMGMAIKKQRRDQVVIHFFGDGGSNRGTFHESLNWSAVQKLPIIFVCENNGWGLSVPTSSSTAVENIADRAAGYGIPGVVVDGGDPEAVYAATAQAAERARTGKGPTLIEIKMVRLLGHWSMDTQDYRPDAADAHQRDPLTALRARLIREGMMSESDIEAVEEEVTATIDREVESAQAAPMLNAEEAFNDLYV